MNGSLWSLATVLGPVLLVAVMAYAMIRNRQASSKASDARTEEATRDLYRKIDEEDKRGEV